jgi:hypothetical protein
VRLFLFLSYVFCFEDLWFFVCSFRFMPRYFDKNLEKRYADLTDETCRTTSSTKERDSGIFAIQ